MTRGKYAARAANRLAEIDAGIVAELREKLSAVTAERDAARAEVTQLRRDQTALAREQAEEMAELAISDLATDLLAEKEARRQDRRTHFRAFLDWAERGDVSVSASWEQLSRVGALFGLSDREAAEIYRIPGDDWNRDARRRSMADLRAMGEFKRRQANRDPKARIDSLENGIRL